ncbi:MAG TPA: 4-(cytidine 5'-diphospho)-2-C-methyl-D-erythritol kinase [Cyclobacteriaceae bacterium]
MVSFPPCKINLGLNILSRRPDGFHDLETVFYPIPWTDVLEIIPSSKLSFQSSGNIIPGREEDNLCLRAYQLLKDEFDIGPVQIHLHKIIPTGAGLGGGSADAAYALRILNEIFELKLSVQQLSSYASQLGSDCAFFIHDEPMHGSGRGELLEKTEVNLKGKFLVLIHPGIHVATSLAFAGVTPRLPAHRLKESIQWPFEKWKQNVENDFEKSVFKSHPAIADLKAQLYAMGAAYASMSGSGSSVFGIFESEIKLPASLRNMNHWSGFL